MKYIFYIIFFVRVNLHAQIPVIENYTINYDSITNNNIYYEDTPKGKILLNNKIIYKPNRVKCLIKNGLVTSEIEKKVLKINKKIFYEYDKINKLNKKITFEDDLLRKVEFFKENKLSKLYKFNLYGESEIIDYVYHNWGYYKYVDNEYMVTKYKVQYDYSSKRIISQIKINSKIVNQVDIDTDENGQQYWVAKKYKSDEIYNKYSSFLKK